MKDNETKEQFIHLRAEGLSFNKISEKIGASKQTLINWSKELKIEIANLKAIELDALQEKYYLTKCKRIELFGEKLLQISTELNRRNLSEIKTDKLFELLEKYATLLKAESEELSFMEKVNLDSSLDLSSIKQWLI